MRVCILIALLPCALLAQTSPPRPADQDAFKKLPQRLDWVQPGTHSPQSEWKMRWFGSPGAVLPSGSAFATLSGVCSIPLLRAPIPKGFSDRISVPTLPGKDFDPKFTLPTPAVCEERKP
jgi:hypothetical protein